MAACEALASGTLHRPVCDLLGCRHPLVLAGRGDAACSAFVSAATLAGGFGLLDMVRAAPDFLREEVRKVRAATRGRFGVSLVPAAIDPERLDRQVAACIALRVPVVCLFRDPPPGAVERLRSAGILVMCRVGSAGEARLSQQAGAQIVVAQGERPPMALLADVLEAVGIPVLAAGGLADGRDVATCLALGAQGALLGTARPAADRMHAVACEAASALFVATRADMAHIEVSSPVCYAREMDEAHRDLADEPEVLGALNELLEAERAGVRLWMNLARHAQDSALEEVAQAGRWDAVRWCGVLTRAIQACHAGPSTRTGPFYEQAMAIEDLRLRLAFLERGREWVAARLRALLPRLREGRLQNELDAMLASHRQGISALRGHLRDRGHAASRA